MTLPRPWRWAALALALCAPLGSAGEPLSPALQAAWRADLAQFAARYPAMHPDPFHALPRAEFEAAVAELDAALPALDADQIVVALMRLVARLGDGHTWLLPHQPATGFAMVPLRLHAFADGLFVTDAQAPHRDLIGARVLALGGTPIEAVTEALLPLVSRDNAMTARERVAQLYLVPRVLRALGLTADAARVAWTLEDASGVQRSVELAPIPVDDYLAWAQPAPTFFEVFPTALPRRAGALYLQDPATDFWLARLSGPAEALYVQYNAVTGRTRTPDGGGETLAAFAARLAAQLDETGLPVIVDLRHNLGGNLNTFGPLLDVLSSHPALGGDGRLFALLGRRTYSAAAVFVDRLRAAAPVTLVGEPSGGGLNFFADNGPLTLPNSGVQVWVSSRPFRTVRDDDAPWHAPHVEVAPRGAEFFSGQDSALDAARARLR